MKKILRQIVRFTAYTVAGIVILLAVVVGLFRLFLPRLPEYQEEIKAWASNAVGVEVEFAAMDARWGLRGPELKFYQAELTRPSGGDRLLAADEVSIGVSVVQLLTQRELVVDTVAVSDTTVELRQLADGSWQIQGAALDELPRLELRDASVATVEFIGEDIEIALIRPGDERPRFFEVRRVVAERDATRTAVDASITLPEAIGRQLTLSATRLAGAGDMPWNVMVDTSNLDLAGLSAALPSSWRAFTSGSASVDLSVRLDAGGMSRLSAEIAATGVSLAGGPAFDVGGRFAVSNDANGWLIAADEFLLDTANGRWPSSTLRLETSTTPGGDIAMLDVRASYLNLADADIAAGWLREADRSRYQGWRPDGILRDLAATVSGVDGGPRNFSLSAELDDVGVAADGERPGVRGFSGTLRVDHEGGLLDIASDGLVLEVNAWLDPPVEFDTAEGTVIWRHSGERTTILSDSISFSNAFLDSQSNIEITIEGDASPVIDLSGSWRIEDVTRAKRYIPERVMKPKLYEWFQQALVSGRIPRGTTRLNGALADFPFEDGNGRLLIEADMRDMRFQYLPQFPAAEIGEMQVTLENVRLFTESNRSISAGNQTVDARVEIADLRAPVLTIDAFSTGTLATIRDFAASSPISRAFGGQLDRVSVAGDASFTLDLTVPLVEWQSYEFTAKITSADGRLDITGLKPPVTALTGTVTVTRDEVSSDGLSGEFLGEPVTIGLDNAGDDRPGYRVVATAEGRVPADAVIEGFGLSLPDVFSGATDYSVDVLFPRARDPAANPFAIELETDLDGLAVDLPAPFAKPAQARRTTRASLSFPRDTGLVRTEGALGDDLAWRLDFATTPAGPDFDRGVLTLGDGAMSEPDVRGLHIRGALPVFRLDDWLSLSRAAATDAETLDRIRSVDVVIDELFLLGQRLEQHRVRVDRSARDWLVQFEGAEVQGSLLVPYEFSADRALVLEMDRLILPGDDTADASGDLRPLTPDPRRLPSIEIKAAEFALGERNFGAVETRAVRTPDGLVADSIVATAPSFSIAGSGRWVADDSDPLGARTTLTATLDSTDVDATMESLNYEPGIDSDDMAILFDLNWSGPPRADFLDTLDGEVRVRLGTGQLNEVEPGAGRMFGLMSIVALPRRLSLDFRDVFQKGFGFDEISGTFQIEDGVAQTCDLSLEGPAAAIGIIGQVDLAAKRYAQTAVVSANVGDTLPVVGALAAGPQVAAAMFLFSQIFKKPLQDIGQVYYDVEGAWTDPAVESVDAEAFAERGRQTGCLNDSR